MFECKHWYHKDGKHFCNINNDLVDEEKCKQCKNFNPKTLDEIIEELRTR